MVKVAATAAATVVVKVGVMEVAETAVAARVAAVTGVEEKGVARVVVATVAVMAGEEKVAVTADNETSVRSRCNPCLART